MLVALGLVHELHGQREHHGAVGARHVALVHGQAVVADLVVADLGEPRLVHVHRNGRRTKFLGHARSLYRLGRAAHRDDDGQGVRTHELGGGTHELVGGVGLAHQLGGLVLHEVLRGVVAAV